MSAETKLSDLAIRVGEKLKQAGCLMTAAESCTGGWVAREITAIPGSSHWFDRGFVTYTNLSKQEMLGVSPETLELHGAVSEATVREMARGALENSQACVSVAISGIAGPGGGTEQKPVGTVWFAWASNKGTVESKVQQFDGGREQVREQAVAYALLGLIEILDHHV